MSVPALFDENLPQLARALDTKLMGDVLGARFYAAHASRRPYRMRSCVVDSARYKPGKSVLIGYRCELENPRDGSVHTTRYAVRLYPFDQSLRRFVKADVTCLVGSPFGPALFHDPELGAIVWAFPNDGKLRQLSALIDPKQLQGALLAPVIRDTCGSGWVLDDLHASIVHYVPEHGCTVRARLALNHDTRGRRELLIYGKHYCPGASAKAFHVLSALRQVAAVREGSLIVARPLGHVAHLDILWTEALPGETLLARIARNDLTHGDWVAIGTSIAALHSAPVSGLPSQSVEDLLSRLDETQTLFERHLPTHTARVANLVGALRNTAPDADAVPAVTLHGDLHPQNLLISDGRVALIDLDAAATGPALLDIGSFCAALHFQALMHGRDATAAIDPFVNTYRAQVSWRVEPRLVAWFTAAALVSERASRCLTRLKPGRAEAMGALFDRAAMLIDTPHAVRSGRLTHV